MSARALILDLDGTLVWLDVAIDAARAAVAALFARRGYDAPFRPILAEIVRAAVAVATSAADRDALVATALAEIDREERIAARTARARSGAARLLATAERADWRLGIVTDNGRACVGLALVAAGLDRPGRFGVVVSRDEVAAPKPAPAGLIAAIGALVPAGGRAVWVGDSPRDVEAGRVARAQLPQVELITVALAGGRGRLASLREAGPDRVLEELDEVIPLLDGGS